VITLGYRRQTSAAARFSNCKLIAISRLGIRAREPRNKRVLHELQKLRNDRLLKRMTNHVVK
jgi:hypothetical protein